MRIRLLCIPVLAAVPLAAEKAPKPVCSEANQGQIWVERSGSGHPLRTEVCSLHVWRYRWTQVTVHASQLMKKPKETKPKAGQR